MRQHTLTRTRSYYARGNCCSVCVGLRESCKNNVDNFFVGGVGLGGVVVKGGGIGGQRVVL